MTLIEELSIFITDYAKKNSQIVVLSPDMTNSSRLNHCRETIGIQYIQLGISEQDMIGIAAGLSHEGYIPVVFSYSAYLLRAYEQIRTAICLDDRNVKLVGTNCSVTGYGPGDRTFEDISIFESMDNIRILIPSNYDELRLCLETMITSKGCFYLRLPSSKVDEWNVNTCFEPAIYRPTVIQRGRNKCIVCYGICVKEVLKNYLGSDYGIISYPFFNTTESRYIRQILDNYNELFFVEDHKRIGSLYNRFILFITENNLINRVHFIGITEVCNTTGNYEDLMKKMEIDKDGIVRRIQAIEDG